MPAAPPCTLPPPPPETLVPGTGIFNSWWFFQVVLPGNEAPSAFSHLHPDLAPLLPGWAQAEGEEGGQ